MQRMFRIKTEVKCLASRISVLLSLHKGPWNKTEPWSNELRRCLDARCLSLSLCIVSSGLAYAHEGHKPLPTRGMEVDPKSGSMTLAKSAVDALDVQTAELGTQVVTQTISAYGELMSPWNQHALVSSPLTGRIVALHVVPGQMVRAGQLLAEIESPELDQLQLDLRTAQLDLDLSKKLAASTEAASKTGAIPKIRLIEAQSKLVRDDAVLKTAVARWRALRLPNASALEILANPRVSSRQRLSLTSPIDGVISHSHLSLGEVVDTKEHLFEVRDLSTVWLKIGVLEKDIDKVKPGQRVDVSFTAWPGEKFTTSIDVVNQALSPESHLGIAWASLVNKNPESARLLPGMTGQIEIHEADLTEKLTIPISSVIRDGAERFVLVEVEKTAKASTFQKQTVALGRRFGNWIEVNGGQLFPGDNVVTQGSHELGGFFAKGVLSISDAVAKDIDLIVQPVSYQAIGNTISIDGLLDVPPTNRTIAASQLAGNLEQILVDRGQKVRRGEILATLYSQDFQNLQLDLLRTSAELTLQQTAVDNLRAARDSVSERQLVEGESRLNQLVSKRETAIRQLQNAGLSDEQMTKLTTQWELIESLPIRAPIDGVVVNFDKFLGHYIQPDEALFEIHDLSKAWVQAFVPENDLVNIRIGQTARVRFVANSSEVIKGTVVRSSGSVGVDERAVSVWIELTEMPTFPVQHNMLVRVAIDAGQSPSQVAVPIQAVVKEGMRRYVFVRTPDQVFERRLVEVGERDDMNYAILSGLQSGELVAVRGAAALQSGYAALR
jgi:membrane fusion protein, heavy metal efflux system